MIAFPRILLSTILFWVAVAAGRISQDVNSEESTVVLTVTTTGDFQVYSATPGSTGLVVSLLPFHNNRVVPVQACRSWQCSSTSVKIIHRDDGTCTVVLAKLQSGIKLAKLLYNATNLWETSTTVLNLNSFLPHHTIPYDLFDIVYIAGGYTAYVSQSNTLFSCDFYNNFTNLSGSRFLCSSLDSLDPIFQSSLASNFVARNDKQVLFAYNGSLYAANYLSYSISYITSLQGALCRRMSYIRDMVYLYCDSNRALTVDLEPETPVVNVHYLNNSGIPFSCAHSPDVFMVSVSPNHTQVTYGSQTFATEGMNFNNGQCIEDSQNRPLFYFIDQSSGLYALNTSSSTMQHVPGACNSTNTCDGLFLYPGLNVVVLRSGSPGELLVYDDNLEVLRQEKLSVEVAGVQLFTISRPITPTTMPSASTPTTVYDTEKPTFTGTLGGRVTVGIKVTDVLMSTTSLGLEITEVEDTDSSLIQPIAISVAVVAAIIIAVIIRNVALKREACCGMRQSKATPDDQDTAAELKVVAQQDSMTHDGPSELIHGISCKKDDEPSKQVISTQEMMDSSFYTDSSKQSSCPKDTSVLQQLMSDHAKHGYPESEPVLPCNAET